MFTRLWQRVARVSLSSTFSFESHLAKFAHLLMKTMRCSWKHQKKPTSGPWLIIIITYYCCCKSIFLFVATHNNHSHLTHPTTALSKGLRMMVSFGGASCIISPAGSIGELLVPFNGCSSSVTWDQCPFGKGMRTAGAFFLEVTCQQAEIQREQCTESGMLAG